MFLTAAVVRAGGGQTEQSTLVAVHCTTWHNIAHGTTNILPLNENEHNMMKRNGNKYVINQHLTERYKVSTIPYLQRLLNEDFHERKKQFKRIMSPVDNNVYFTAGKI